jgi:flagellar motor switch protein FliN/FliY
MSAEDESGQNPPGGDAPGPPARETPGQGLGDELAHQNVTFEKMEASDTAHDGQGGERTAADLEAVFDVPVRVSVVLGRTKMPIANLLKMDVGAVVELDRQVGEAIDIYVNDRLVARGEIVLVEEQLGVTMTEIIKAA